jgi:hypothetical protein
VSDLPSTAQAGMLVVEAAGTVLAGLSFPQVTQLLKGAARPLPVRFQSAFHADYVLAEARNKQVSAPWNDTPGEGTTATCSLQTTPAYPPPQL